MCLDVNLVNVTVELWCPVWTWICLMCLDFNLVNVTVCSFGALSGLETDVSGF